MTSTRTTRSMKWDQYVGALEQYVEREGNGRVPASHVEVTGSGALNLGAWVAYVRQRKRAGLLTAEQVERLSSVPSWEWGPLRPGPVTDEARNNQIRSLRSQRISLQKIGDAFGLSRQRIHQILKADQ